MVAIAPIVLYHPSDLLTALPPERQSSFGSTHSRHSFSKPEEEAASTPTTKKSVRFLCTDELDLSDSNSDGSFSQDTYGTIQERVIEFERVDPLFHGEIWYTGSELLEFRVELRRTAQQFGTDYPAYGELLNYLLHNGPSINSDEIDVERLRSRRRRKDPFAVSMQWLSISEDIEDERYDDDGDEEEDMFQTCDDEEEDCDFFPVVRGLENRVIPDFRQRRRWAVNQILRLQNDLKKRSYDQKAMGLRILSLQVSKLALTYAQHQAFLDAREAANLHGL